jgi:hypothetical protein
MPISVFAPGSTGAQAYQLLAKELLQKDNVRESIIQEAM